MNESSSTSFGDSPGVERSTAHGLPCVRVHTRAASGLVFLQGAHIAEWLPAEQGSVIWMSDRALYQTGKALRGGVPICFPWFGAHAEHKNYPAHGFARTTDFKYQGARLDDGGRTELEFLLEDDAATYAVFPHAFEARLRVAFGETLGIAFSVTNRSSDPFAFEEALHSYFHVADVRDTAVVGLQGSNYHDKTRGLAELSESAPELRLRGETDRVYDSSAACTIVDVRGRRSFRVEKSRSQNTVVWNPWAEKAAQMADMGSDAWLQMLCVESANVAGSRVSLDPGTSHTLAVTISVASSG